MALDDIFRALEEQADQEIEDILGAARMQADAIAGEAADESEQIRSRRLEQAERAARSSSAQKLNAVRLENKKRLAAIKEKAVQASFSDAVGALGTVRNRSDYSALFRALAREALEVAKDAEEVWVDPADEALAAETLKSLGSPAKVVGKLETAGGLVAVTGGGRIMVKNTLEDRLAKLRHIGQASVAEILFS